MNTRGAERFSGRSPEIAACSAPTALYRPADPGGAREPRIVELLCSEWDAGPQLPESFAAVHRAGVDSTRSPRRQENGRHLLKTDQKRSEDLAGLMGRTER